MFDDIKQEATEKLIKVKLYLSGIDSGISRLALVSDEFQNSLKGLFFVYLYGIFEMTVIKTIRRTIDELNSADVRISECKRELLSLILSPEYDALHGVGENKKWPRRWDISRKLIDNEKLDIVENLIPTDGRNIKKDQLESIYKSFGNSNPVFPRPEIQGYLDELVRYRNYIAHGDMLPQEIGRNYTVADLEKRRGSIDELCTYIIDSYESYIVNQEYLV